MARYETNRNSGDQIAFSIGSGNVFADLGRPDAVEALLKADLARQIGRIIGERQLTQTDAATLLGADQPKVSALLRGKLSGFSLDRLVRYAAALDQDVQIVVRPKKPLARVAESSARAAYRTKTKPASKTQVRGSRGA